MTSAPNRTRLDEDVRKAGLGLIIVAALPVFISIVVFSQVGGSSLKPVAGLIAGGVLAGLGALVLARKWPALYVAALLCGGAAIAIAVASVTKGKWAGLILAGGLVSAAFFFWTVGGELRAGVVHVPSK